MQLECRIRRLAQVLFKSSLCLSVVLSQGCGDSSYNGLRPVRGSTIGGKVPTADIVPVPFRTWAQGDTIGASPRRDAALAHADQLADSGNIQGAVSAYRVIMKRAPKRSIEAESAAVHAAATLLSTVKAPEAVQVLSDFYKRHGFSEREVSPEGALVLAYGFGQLRNYDQALAWFNQVLTDSRSNPRLTSAAEQGTSMLLATVPESELPKIQSSWRGTTAVSHLVGQEVSLRLRRAARTPSALEPFWVFSEQSLTSPGGPVAPAQPGTAKFLVFLPLTGRFANIGKAAQAGMELAADAYRAKGSTVELVFEDEAGDSLRAGSVLRNRIGEGFNGVIGPLMTENAATTASVARELRAPILLLSKSDSLPLGEGVSRFGLTSEAQAKSLVQGLSGLLPRARVAVVYASDDAGHAFAEAMRRALGDAAITPLLERSYEKGNAADLGAAIADFEAHQCDIVFFGDNVRAAAQFFGGLPSALRSRVLPVGGALWDNLVELNQSRTVMEGAVFVSAFPLQSSRSEVVGFIDSYRAKTAKAPDIFAAHGYDAMSLALGALERSGSANLADALTSAGSLDGLTGVAAARGDGEIERQLPVMQFFEGQIVSFDQSRVSGEQVLGSQ